MTRPARVLIALIALAIIGGSHAAFGATQLSKTGSPGPWSILDTDDRTAGRCDDDSDGPEDMGKEIDILSAVRTPRVRAKNRTAARDSQWVGGKVFFQRSVNPGGSGGWVNADKAKLAKKLAFDNQAVSWGGRSWVVDIDEDHQFRITVLLRWYKPGSKTQVQGTRKILYERYLKVFGSNEDVANDHCIPEY